MVQRSRLRLTCAAPNGASDCELSASLERCPHTNPTCHRGRLADAAEVYPRIRSMLGDRFKFASLQQAYDSPQIFPRRLIQLWTGTDQVANHIPGCNV